MFKKDSARIDVSTLEMPALALDKNFVIQARSASGDHLAALYSEDGTDIQALAQKAFETGTLVEDRIRSKKFNLTYYLVGLCSDDNTVVIAGRDHSMQDKVTEALMASRNMFKDMVSCSADFGWEVDKFGQFTFIGPGSVFGKTADDLLGRSASQFFWPVGNGPASDPFCATKEYTSKPLKVTTPEGDRWFSFSVKPLLDDDGGHTAVRGVCQDVTELVEQERVARHHALRLSLQGEITSILQTSKGSQELLSNAVNTLAEMLRAENCWILLSAARGLSLVAKKEAEDTENTDDQPVLNLKEMTTALSQHLHLDEAFEMTVVGQSYLAVRLMAGDDVKGIILLNRNTDIFPWSLQEKALLSGIADNMVVALTQAELIERLNHLSSSDELTGLMNRRALADTVSQRLKNNQATGQVGTILFVDLDHFKEINDTLGHAAGDLALKKVATLLQDQVREQDCVARIGGDEFIVWLNTAGADVGVKKAEALLEQMADIRKDIGAEHLRLSMSIGIVQSDPTIDHKLDEMTDVADHVMYEAKKKGKSTYVIGQVADYESIRQDGE